MCNHYVLKNVGAAIELARRKAQEPGIPWEVTADAWPKTPMPVVFQREGKRTLEAMRWGFRPYYDPAARPVVNARDDSLLTKNMWKTAAKRGRCLVPADGFFEWTGPKGAMWEVLFTLRDERPFFFAGLWSRDPDGESRGFALVTGKPNELVAALPHDRMPVILDDTGADAWLGEEPLPDERLLSLCAPYPATEMVRTDMPVRPRISKSNTKSAVDSGDTLFG